jgi:hypothetical protein
MTDSDGEEEGNQVTTVLFLFWNTSIELAVVTMSSGVKRNASSDVRNLER